MSRFPAQLVLAVALLLLLMACTPDGGQPSSAPRRAADAAPLLPPAASPPTASQRARFDYWLMALSWSPTWCEANPGNHEQCGNKGFGFVMHGLWPQYQSGRGPQDCPTRERVSERTIQRSLGFMPSRGLIIHEWRSHGACSGLDSETYFQLADRAFASVRIPEPLRAPRRPPQMTAADVKAAFVKANPGLAGDALQIICKGERLSEVRICLDTHLESRQCGAGTRSRCPAGKLRIAVVR